MATQTGSYDFLAAKASHDSLQEQIDPIATKTYTGIIGTANTAADASFYFAKVHPDDYNGVWQVKLRINVTEPVLYQEIVDVTVSGRASAYMAYDAVSHRSNSALAINYLNLYRAKQAGITAGKGHALGFGLRASTNPANATYARTITVEVLEQVNCTVQLLDAAVKYASMDGTGATNYAGLTELNIGAYGQNATNNVNTYDRTLYNSNVKAAANLTAGSIVCGTSAGYKNIAAGTAFDIGYPLLYNNTAYNSGGVRADLDLVRTNINFSNNGTIESATAHELVFLKGTVVGNSFTIAAAPFLTCKVPDGADGYCYLPLGRLRDSTTNGQFTSTSELWCFKDGAFGPVSLREAEAAKKTATNYITRQGSGDTWVHAENLGPGSDNEPLSTTRGWRIGEVFELWRDGLSHFKVWVEDSIAKVRVGLESAGHSVFSPEGMEVFTDADTSVASFGATSRIGKAFVNGASDNESHMELNYRSLQMVDKEGSTYFHVSDLRDSEGYVTDTFTGDGRTRFELSTEASDTSTMSVTVDETEVTSGITKTTTEVTFSTAHSSGSVIKIRYLPSDADVKAYTFGKRTANRKIGVYSVAEGDGAIASGYASHAESGALAEGFRSHAENGGIANGERSHAEGSGRADGAYSHAEGYRSKAIGIYSHAEGWETEACGPYCHTEGCYTYAGIAANPYIGTESGGHYAHAEGFGTEATAPYSHAQNQSTTAASDSQTALGKFNVEDANDAYAAIVGNGTSGSARSNALAVRWDGTCDVGNQQAVAGDNHAYPLFIWTSSMTNPESYSGTYPVSPCFVYYVPNNGLYYCEN